MKSIQILIISILFFSCSSSEENNETCFNISDAGTASCIGESVEIYPHHPDKCLEDYPSYCELHYTGDFQILEESKKYFNSLFCLSKGEKISYQNSLGEIMDFELDVTGYGSINSFHRTIYTFNFIILM